MENKLAIFESKEIRKVWYNYEWYFSIVDVVGALTDLELIFTMLGEKVTTEISDNEESETFEENKKVARRGGNVAKNV